MNKNMSTYSRYNIDFNYYDRPSRHHGWNGKSQKKIRKLRRQVGR